MNNDQAKALKKEIEAMREAVSEFQAEFALLSNEDLEQLADQQAEIAAAAEFKKDAAETEIRLRLLRAAIAPTPK